MADEDHDQQEGNVADHGAQARHAALLGDLPGLQRLHETVGVAGADIVSIDEDDDGEDAPGDFRRPRRQIRQRCWERFSFSFWVRLERWRDTLSARRAPPRLFSRSRLRSPPIW